MELLIIEDGKELPESIAAYLGSEDYVCGQAFTYAEAAMKVNLYGCGCVSRNAKLWLAMRKGCHRDFQTLASARAKLCVF